MKLIVPKEYTGSIIDASGQTYAAAPDGTVDVPDELVHYGFWGCGFIRCPVAVAVSVKPAQDD